jgi:hypothetical protein
MLPGAKIAKLLRRSYHGSMLRPATPGVHHCWRRRRGEAKRISEKSHDRCVALFTPNLPCK